MPYPLIRFVALTLVTGMRSRSKLTLEAAISAAAELQAAAARERSVKCALLSYHGPWVEKCEINCLMQ